MQADQLNRLKAWFSEYSSAFLTGDTNVDSPLVLKIDHTRRVCDNIRRLAVAVHAGNGHVNLAEAVGLCHDVGRFEQYRRYATFNDRVSVNHGALGIEVLQAEQALATLTDVEKTIIIDAVRFHNARALPTRRFGGSMLFMRLIRDADKLDIWKIFADYFRESAHPVAAVVQHLPESPTWSASIVAAIMDGVLANFSDMRSLNDFKLLQLSWVFDLQFAESARISLERDDLDVIAAALPDSDELAQAIDRTRVHLKERAHQADVPTA